VRGYIPDESWVHWPEPPAWVAGLYTVRWLIRGVLIAAGLGLLYLEWQARAVSGLLQNALARRGATLLLLGLLSALLGTFVFQPGNYIVADNRANVSMPWAVLQLIQQGNWPVIWTTYVHLGSPFMQLHNSLYYYVAALLGLLIPNFFDVSEIMAFLIFVGSSYALFLYVTELTESRVAGFVATMAWCGSFYRFQQIALGANLPLTTFIAFWPIQFYCIERVVKSERAINLWLLSLVALTVGTQIWIHTLHGAWMLPLGLLYAGVRVWFQAPSGWLWKFKQFLGLLAAHIGGALIGAYLLAPIALESHLIPTTPVREAGLGFEDILDFKRVWDGGFISYSILALALLGLILVIAFRYRRAYAIATQTVVLLVVIFGPHYAPWINDLLAHIPLGNLVYARGAGRYLMVVFGPLTALVGIGAQLLTQWLQGLPRLKDWVVRNNARLSLQIALLATTLILVENIPLTLRVNYKSPDSYLIDSTGRWPLIDTLAKTPDKTTRVLDMGEGLTPSFLYPMLTGHPSLSGNYEEAPASFSTSEHLVDLLRVDLKNGSISSATSALLYQFNIGYLITQGPPLEIKELELIQRSDSAALWRVPNHSPVVASASPATLAPVTVTLPQGGDVPVTDIQLTETAATATLKFSLPSPAFVQLAYSAYPYQQVELDGQTITVATTPLGLIGFQTDSGSHSVTISPELSPWRKITLPISLAAVVVIAGLGLWARRKQ
jgi:hypothetical protein